MAADRSAAVMPPRRRPPFWTPNAPTWPSGSLAAWNDRYVYLIERLQEEIATHLAIQSETMPLRRRLAEVVSRQKDILNERKRWKQAGFGLTSVLFASSAPHAARQAGATELSRLNDEERQLEKRIHELSGDGRVTFNRRGNWSYGQVRKQQAHLLDVATPLDTPHVQRIFNLCEDILRLISQKPTPEQAAERKLYEESVARRRQMQLEKEAADNAAKAEREAVKKQKAEARRAAVASALGKTREQADRVKRSLAKDHECPYCGDSLGDEPHADHIYPVSKGGRSVAVNMVYACSGCNSNKGDMTLAAFIACYSLDREAIEQRLRLLGKEY